MTEDSGFDVGLVRGSISVGADLELEAVVIKLEDEESNIEAILNIKEAVDLNSKLCMTIVKLLKYMDAQP
jgi:hypothetical protein